MAAVDDTFRLLSDDLLNGARWLDVRKAQDPARTFGPGPTAAWVAFRSVMPLRSDSDEATPRPGEVAYKFLKANPASNFVPMDDGKIGASAEHASDKTSGKRSRP
jgi:histidine ammonia-lyase